MIKRYSDKYKTIFFRFSNEKIWKEDQENCRTIYFVKNEEPDPDFCTLIYGRLIRKLRIGITAEQFFITGVAFQQPLPWHSGKTVEKNVLLPTALLLMLSVYIPILIQTRVR